MSEFTFAKIKIAAAAVLSAALLSAGETIEIRNAFIPELQPELNPVWTCFEQPDLSLFKEDMLKKVPETIGNVKPQKVSFTNGFYRFKRDQFVISDYCLFFNEFETDRDAMLTLGFGADWFMKVWLDGLVLVDTLKNGNNEGEIDTSNYVVRLYAPKGRHVLAAEVHSGTASFTFAAGKLPPPIAYIPLSEFQEHAGKTDWRKVDPERQACMNMLEKAVLDMTSIVFNAFNRIPEKPLKEYHDLFPVLAVYDGALDKIIREIPQTEVKEGTVVLWHLYNMGYVIKTHNHCFGIDLHHRRAHLLAPYLDFLLISHAHSDHVNMKLLYAMTDAGKKVYSSFFKKNPGCMEEPGTIQIDDITITTERTDHGKQLPKFITTYLIQIGNGDNACVIYQTGDSCNHEQLNPGKHVNIWIPHPRVGLSVINGAKKFKPDWIFFSHLLEMGHCKPSPWRPVTFRELRNDIRECGELGVRSTCPFWGEKIVWTPADK